MNIEQPLNTQESEKGLKKELSAMYVRTTSSAMAGGLVGPYIGILAVDMNSNATILAWIQSISNLLSTFLTPIFGKMSDFVHRRIPFVFFSTLFWVFPYLFLIWIKNPIFIIFIIAAVNLIMSFGGPAWTALQNELFPKQVRAKLAGNLIIYDSIGRIITTILTGFILTILFDDTNIQRYIWIPIVGAIFFSIISAIPLLIIQEPYKKKSKTLNDPVEKLEGIKDCLKNKPFKKFFIISMIQGYFYAFAWPVLPIVLRDKTFFGATVLEIAYFNIIYAITSLLFINIGAKLSDRYGRTKLLFFNRLILFTFPVSYLLASNMWQLLVITFFFTALFNIGFPSLVAYLFDIVPEKSGGTYFGLYNMGVGVAQFLGSLTCGYLVDALTLPMGFKLAVILALLISACGRLGTSFLYLSLKEVSIFPSKFNDIFRKHIQKRKMQYKM